jgi:predicted AlkP superfamily phosphohydrolase/phosphomutase
MFPPPAVHGAVVPGGMMPWRQLRLGCHPPGLFDRLRELPDFNPREMLDMELEIKAIDGCPDGEHAEFVELHIRRERRWANVLRHLMACEQADLVAVLFDGVDKLQHLCWRFIDPACRPQRPDAWERHMISLCERYFRSLDDLIAGIVKDAGAGATVVLASDHGFGPTQDVFHVNSWLESNGYLSWSNGERESARGETDVGFAEMTRHVHALDWSRTVAYAATPSSQGIHIVDTIPGGEEPLSRDERATIANEIARALRELRRLGDGVPLVEEVWTREEAFGGPYEELGPDLSLLLADGATMSILPSAAIVARRPRPRGHHRMEGFFLAAGPGIRAGADLGELSIVDVAPLLLHRIGLAAPEDMAGGVPARLFEPEELERHAPRRVRARATAATVPVGAGEELGIEEQAALMKRLRALGYVE